MLSLPASTWQLILVTGAAVASIEVDASWVDITPQPAPTPPTVTPDSLPNTIAAAATTVIVPPPAVGTQRNVKYVSIRNTSGNPCAVAVRVDDGASPQSIFAITLLPGYVLEYNTDGNGWRVKNVGARLLVDPGVPSLAVSAQGNSVSSGTVVWSNSPTVSFGMVGSTITASAIVTGNAGINLSAGTTSNLASAFTFSNSNGLSFGLNAQTLTASFAFRVSAGTTSNALSGVTFGNSNGVTFGLNNGTLTASVAPAATVSCFSQDADFVTNWPVGQAVLSFQKLSLPAAMSATQLLLVADFLGASNVSDAVTVSHAVYTFNNSTASLASSGSRVISWTSGSATTASSLYGGASGTRYRSVAVNYSMTPGDYLFAWYISTANGASVNVFGRAGMNLVGIFDGVETTAPLNGLSASTVNALPAAVALTDTGYVRTAFSAMRQPGAILFGTGL